MGLYMRGVLQQLVGETCPWRREWSLEWGSGEGRCSIAEGLEDDTPLAELVVEWPDHRRQGWSDSGRIKLPTRHSAAPLLWQ